MKTKIISSLLILAFVSKYSFGQEGIHFHDGSLSTILSIAKDKNRNVFIDTYADWCQPCKRMETKFKDKEVARFFNENFVNYRVNMQNPIKANQLRKRYDIVFLPNMLIVDPNGVVKYQVDRELSKRELLNMGQKSLDPTAYHISESTIIRRNNNQTIAAHSPSPYPIKNPNATIAEKIVEPKSTTNNLSISQATRRAKILESYETIDESSEKILAVLGEGEVPPEVLFQEAYLRLEFMDGSHKQAAKKYLETQENWNTEINRKFILDFVNNSNSQEYQFILANKEKFIQQFGKQKIKQTLEIITYRALYNALPRPTLKEAIQLYTNLGSEEPVRKGYNYFISRLILEDKVDEVLIMGDQYLASSPTDHEIKYNVARFLTYRTGRTEANLQKASTLMKEACNLQPKSLIYLDLLGEIYTAQDNKKGVKDTYLKAIKEAKNQGKDFQPYIDKGSGLNG